MDSSVIHLRYAASLDTSYQDFLEDIEWSERREMSEA
jgi:hypothetical protein